jgi:hypothetical protein
MLVTRVGFGAKGWLAVLAVGAIALGCGKKSADASGGTTTTTPVATAAQTVLHLDAGVHAPAKPPWCHCPSLTTKPAPGGCIAHATCTATGVQGWYCSDGKTCECGPSLDGCK